MPILIGYGIGGFCLASCQTKLLVWTVIYFLVIYTSMTGKGGIALSSLLFSSILTIYTLVNPWPFLESILFLDSAQIWAFSLLSAWSLGILLICLLGSAAQSFANQRWPKWQYVTCLTCLSGLALELGRNIFLYLAKHPI
ncbi:MAG: hypothetical protein F6K11_35425 [Leptolyngbya sp. SIO3F4]|nr:hypothetical protein [Leptolyngbya sp. SIO3F4]